MSIHVTATQRRGSMLVEVSAAMLILALVLPIVAQLGYWSLRQRARTQSRQTALDLAHNVLESARAVPFSDLTEKWAAAQKIPEEIIPLLPGGALAVTITADIDKVRRVTAAVSWQEVATGPPQQLQLTTLLAARPLPGGKP